MSSLRGFPLRSSLLTLLLVGSASTLMPPPPSPAPPPMSECTNTCGHSGDGDCDDGGPGAEYSYCSLGTDCHDCGPSPTSECNTCSHSSDGECDDGGPGAEYALCSLGTDCDDCGGPSVYPPPPSPPSVYPPPPSPAPPPTSECTNSCYYSSDGECDDGGPGAEYSHCSLGTDCDDCGGQSVYDERCQSNACTFSVRRCWFPTASAVGSRASAHA